MSSTNGMVAEADVTHNNASKGGLEMLTKSLAIELAPHGIRVNSVAPGILPTDNTETFLAGPPSGNTTSVTSPWDGSAARKIVSVLLYFWHQLSLRILPDSHW